MKVYSVEEISKMIGINKRTLQRKIVSIGLLPTKKKGNTRYYCSEKMGIIIDSIVRIKKEQDKKCFIVVEKYAYYQSKMNR